MTSANLRREILIICKPQAQNWKYRHISLNLPWMLRYSTSHTYWCSEFSILVQSMSISRQTTCTPLTTLSNSIYAALSSSQTLISSHHGLKMLGAVPRVSASTDDDMRPTFQMQLGCSVKSNLRHRIIRNLSVNPCGKSPNSTYSYRIYPAVYFRSLSTRPKNYFIILSRVRCSGSSRSWGVGNAIEMHCRHAMSRAASRPIHNGVETEQSTWVAQ